MAEVDRTDVVNSKTWRELKDWARASVELENSRVVEAILRGNEGYNTGYRDAMEHTLGMMVAFEHDQREET